jgi:hypothetical protein
LTLKVSAIIVTWLAVVLKINIESPTPEASCLRNGFFTCVSLVLTIDVAQKKLPKQENWQLQHDDP